MAVGVAIGVLAYSADAAERFQSIVGTLVEPVNSGLTDLALSGERWGTVISRADELARENEELRERVGLLESELVRAKELEIENADLRNLLELKARTGSPRLAPVRVIARDPSPYVQAITVDRGTDDGVRDGMPVVSWTGLVGRVTKASSSSARVLLITDINSSITSRVQSHETRATGTLRGRADGGLLMQHIPQEEPVQTGDKVITSDLGGLLPSGLLIGEVVQVRRKDVEVFQEALVMPSTDMRRLDRLYVLLSPPTPRGGAQ